MGAFALTAAPPEVELYSVLSTGLLEPPVTNLEHFTVDVAVALSFARGPRITENINTNDA